MKVESTRPTESAETRRSFIRKAATLAAAAPTLLPSSVWAAPKRPSNRITLGFIGMGKQNSGLLNGFLHNPETQVVAVCDVDTTRREHAKKTVKDYYAQQTNQGSFKGCDPYKDFRELIARQDIDAVVVATPDHWHALIVMAAANAGKDIYCEKPLSLTIAEARAMVTAVRRNHRICQTGSMQRSSREFRKACELVRNGRIGKVKTVIVGVGAPSKWCDLPEEAMEPGLDWDFWLGPAAVRPYNSVLSPRGVHNHFPNWRNYREYSGGMMTDWGAHHFDIAQWGLGMDASGPVEIIPPEGPNATTGVRYLYANGVEMIHDSSRGGATFIGSDGKIFVDRGKLEVEPESIEQEPPGGKDIRLYVSNDHLRDWLSCVRTRKLPICDVEIGCRSVTVCHLGNLAYWNHRHLRWDPKEEQFIGDKEANTWLDRAKRAPWKI
ncbi:MAG: Gfo/Idh/MocA family oxidoreductase [Verrucomicrobia bacterium]|jgi:predicted dehydrogenase|nr:Gfo/Idh/MocA family oxidoreductase [Verrucomicrobiota bacterium]